MDYFGEFGLRRSFIIDLDLLEESYLSQQLKYHPDQYVNADSDTKQRALEKTIGINKAYDTLKSDIDRAFYLLELEGVLLNQEENLVDFPELLADVFAERESLSMTNSKKEIAVLYEVAQRDLAEYKRNFNEQYEAKNFNGASVLYKKILYKIKIIDEIKMRLNSSGDM